MWEGGSPATPTDPKIMADDATLRPPECERFSEIAAKLKEIEAERLRAAQAATLPEEKR